MLTARSEERDELQGFELGVDEYISKPFSPKILVARVGAILRRINGTDMSDILDAGGIKIDKAAHSVMIDDKPIDLSYKEFELLRLFLSHPGMAFPREQLFSQVWNMAYMDDSRTLDMHIRTLRQKLGDAGTHIQTIRSVGYRWEDNT